MYDKKAKPLRVRVRARPTHLNSSAAPWNGEGEQARKEERKEGRKERKRAKERSSRDGGAFGSGGREGEG